MKFKYVPLLQQQRDLYDIPRGPQRFQAYLKMVRTDGGEMNLPLAMLNPMGKDHVPAYFDQLLAMDADGIGEAVSAEVAAKSTAVDGELRLIITVADDLGGGWTNRFDWEFKQRFETRPYHRHGWLTAVLWSAEPPTAKTVHEELLTTAFRGAYIQQHGYANTLREKLAQESYALGMADVKQWMDVDEVAYSAEILNDYLDSEDEPVQLVSFYGDAAADELGLPKQGLSERAGLAVALAEWKKR